MWTYIFIGVAVAVVLLLCFALAVASFSFDNYAEKLKQLDATKNSSELSTLEFVQEINKAYFGEKISLVETQEWHDHYSSKTVALSEKTMQSNSLASFAIVGHELGHARQDFMGNLKKHWKLRKSGRVCGLFFLPLLLAGLVLCLLWVFDVLPEIYFLVVGLVCFVFALMIFVFALILKYREIKVEKEASKFALDFLNEVLTESEVNLCKQLLDSARLTYWGSLIRTMLSWTLLTGKDKMFK